MPPCCLTLDQAMFNNMGRTWQMYAVGHTFKVRLGVNYVLARQELNRAKLNTGRTWQKYAVGHTLKVRLYLNYVLARQELNQKSLT